MRRIILWLLPALAVSAAVSSLLYEIRRNASWSDALSEYGASSESIYITGIAFDSSNHPWLGNCGTCTPGRGLVTFNSLRWETYTEENSGLASNEVVEVAVDLEDQVWVGYEWFGGGYGISSFDGSTWTSYTIDSAGLLDNAVDKIAVDPSNRIWISYGGEGSTGISVFDGQTWTNHLFEPYLENQRIKALAVDLAGRVWLGFESGGVSVFDGTWRTYTQENSGLASNDVFGIAFDSTNNAWIGTLSGISIFDGESWIDYHGGEGGLLRCPISSRCTIAIDPSDSVWMSNGESGVSMFDGSDWVILTEDNSGLNSNKIRDLVIDRTGKTWIITSAGVSVPPEKPLPITPSLVQARNLLFSPKRSLWIVLSLLAGFWVVSFFTIGNRSETIKRLGISLAFGCLGFIGGILVVGLILGLLGWGNESLIYGILVFGVPVGLLLCLLIVVRKFRSLPRKGL